MPRVNIYIRKEDEKKWAALPSKAEFIHNALNKGASPTVAPPPDIPPEDDDWEGPVFRNKKKSKL